MMALVMASKKKKEEPDNLPEELDELEKKIERLRTLYEQYFIGIEKRPPSVVHRDVNRVIRQIANYQIRKTTNKFRYQALVQRFNLHLAYWARVCREIEEGRYTRHHRRVEKRELERSGERLDNAELAKRALLAQVKGMDAVDERRERQHQDGTGPDPAHLQAAGPKLPAIARRIQRRKKKDVTEIRGASADQIAQVNAQTFGEGGGGSPAPARPAAPLVGAGGGAAVTTWSERGRSLAGADILGRAGISEQRARVIYDTLVSARRQQGEGADDLSFDRIVRSMAKQVPKVRDTHGAEQMDFAVVRKGDKVYLKPVPK
jgi:hypothetical protein